MSPSTSLGTPSPRRGRVNVLVGWGGDEEHLEAIRAVSRRLELFVARAPEERLRLAPEAEVWFGWGLSREVFAAAKKLRWIQVTSAGVDRLLFDELRRSDVIVTNARGVYSIPIAEQVLAMMLAFARQLPTCIREQSRGRWAGSVVGGKPVVLAGKTCVVLGLGDIGTEVARRAKAFGMKVLGIRRRPGTLRVSWDAFATDSVAAGEPPRPAPAGQKRPSLPGFVDEVVDQRGMQAVLARADYLVVALPLTEATRHIVDAQALSVLKPTACVFNIGRGALIDEPALIRALQEGRLAGAGLDVFEQEPLPPESPLYRMENVIITPHSGGRSPENGEKLVSLFCRNLRRYLARKPLLNLVDKAAGY